MVAVVAAAAVVVALRLVVAVGAVAGVALWVGGSTVVSFVVASG